MHLWSSIASPSVSHTHVVEDYGLGDDAAAAHAAHVGVDDEPHTPRFGAVVGWILDMAALPALASSGFGHVSVPEEGGDEAGAAPTAPHAPHGAGDLLPALFGAHGSAARAGKGSAARAGGVGQGLFGAGLVSQSLASETVALARTLLSFQRWRDVLGPSLTAAFVEAAAHCAPQRQGAPEPPVDTQAAARILGSLSILGAFVEPLRVGARVCVAPERAVGPPPEGDLSPPEPALEAAGARGAGGGSLWGLGIDMSGTLVRLHVGDARAEVVYTRDLSATPSSVDSARLRPVSDVPAPSTLLRLSEPAILAAAKALVRLGVTANPGAEPSSDGPPAAGAGASAFATRVHGMTVAVLQVWGGRGREG